MKSTKLLLVLLLPVLSFGQNRQLQITDLQCEHLTDPIGIDSPSPRFTWTINNSETGIRQTAFRLLVASDSAALYRGKADIWDSGEIHSDLQLAVVKGIHLISFNRYYWQVMIRDEKSKIYQSSPIAFFETAMMNPDDWEGKWISDGKSMHYKPAPCFRKEINIIKEIQSAKAYITAAGLYELSINGVKAGNQMLDPMYTRFDRRNLYTTLDISSQLKPGRNAVGVLLGNGWYNHQSTAVWHFDKAPWRNRPGFLLNIKIHYKDGSTDTFASDETWKTADSPVIFNSIYTAEHYDARKEMPGWNKPGYNDSTWKNAISISPPSGQIASQQLYPIRVTNRLKPVKTDKQNDSCYVFSFPRNIAGITSLTIKGKKGTILEIKHGERLYSNGRVDLSNIDLHYRPTDNSDPFQTDIFILSGNNDRFAPKFNYKGFQYVEIGSSVPIELTADNIEALEMHSDVPQTGWIQSSNPVLNKIWEAGNSSYLANLFGYPTDCPQREKNGWTGDAHIAVQTGLYSFDAITVYEKWMNDFRDEQQPNGVLPSIVPTWGWGYDWGNGPDWTSTVAIIPWEIYNFYGDKHLLKTMYDNIKLYVDYIHSISPNDTTNWGLGDWVPVKTVSSKTLTSSLYYYADVTILSKAAKLFGKTEDARSYAQLAEQIKNAINKHFLDRNTGIYCSGSQTELAAPLYWGIVPDDLKKKVARNLYNEVVKTGFHIDTGILGAKALLHALTENGYADAAYKIASQETYPSWGYWIVNGATTFYENWRTDVAVHDASLNHIMFGDINAWMYKGLGGIYPDENNPGFKHIILKPNFPEGLDQFEASHRSNYGLITSKWKKSGKEVTYEVRIPANSSATLYLPGHKIKKLYAGKHTFKTIKTD